MEFIQNNKDGQVYATLFVPELKEMPEYEKIVPLLTFPVSTYTKLTKNGDGWGMTYGIVNQFLSQLSEEHKIAIAATLAAMHREIIVFFNENDLTKIQSFIHGLNEKLDRLDQTIDLCGQLHQYIVENVTIGLFEGAGERAQDSDDLTFRPAEVIDLTTICVLSKMLSPIFGTIMRSLNKKIDNKFRDLHCFYIYTNLLNRRYRALYKKLEHYVEHTTEQTVKKESMSLLVNGYNIFSMAHQMLGELLVRQFVNCDLTVKDGNLMTYVIVAVKRSIRTVMSNIGKNPTYNRIPIESSHDEDGNAAQLEIDSISSRKTADSQAIIKFAVKQTMKRFKTIYQINDEEFAASAAYYQRNPIVPNIINQDLTSLFFQKGICGAKSIQMLKANELGELVTLLQLIVASLDTGYDELVHALTTIPALDVSLEASIMDGKTRLNSSSSDYYRKCKMMFESFPFYQKGTKSWDFYMMNLVDTMLTSSWIYNTSDFVWDFLEQENKNGKIFTPTEKTFTALCSVYLLVWELQKSKNGEGLNTAIIA